MIEQDKALVDGLREIALSDGHQLHVGEIATIDESASRLEALSVGLDTQDTLVERLHEAADRVAKKCMGHDVPALISIPRRPTDIDVVIGEAATALADRDAKIAELTAQYDELLRVLNASSDSAVRDYAKIKALTAHAEAAEAHAEAHVAELTQKLERATALVKRIPAALSDSFSAGVEEREGGSWRRQERYSVSVDALRNDVRAFLNSGASQNG